MDSYLPAELLQSLIQEKGGFTWSDRISSERSRGGVLHDHHQQQQQQHHQPHHHTSQSRMLGDDNVKKSDNKRVRWDELVHVRQFEAFKEELKDSYPRTYPYKHGGRRETSEDRTSSTPAVSHLNPLINSHYFTSQTFDL